MRQFTAFLAIAAACFASGSDVYHVQHQRASKILGLVTGGRLGERVALYVAPATPGKAEPGLGLVPAGVQSVKADDVAGTITIEGTPDGSKNLQDILALFDVEPRQVGAEVLLSSPADKWTLTTKTHLQNNAPWTIEDGVTGVKLTILARINADGTLTGMLTVGEGKKARSLVARVKNKEALHLKIVDDGTLGLTWGFQTISTTPAKEDKKPKVPEIDVTIQFDIAEAPNSGPIRP
ncbi:MAG TPA: hypothetical protein VG820_01790 [Fimbriimonadaceae bacterium]|nr:hypothetical protein [Fimbriimonadaceae bacterium]